MRDIPGIEDSPEAAQTMYDYCRVICGARLEMVAVSMSISRHYPTNGMEIDWELCKSQ